MEKRNGGAGSALARAFLWVWVLLGAAAVTAACAFFPKESGAPASLLWALPFLGLWGSIARFLPEKTARRSFPWACALAAAASFAVSVWFMRVYRYEPLWDPAALFYGAQGWARGDLLSIGSPTFRPETYFYYFPNNLGATAVLAAWFRTTRPGDPYLAACTLNAVLLSAAFVGTALAAREIAGPRAGLCALAILACTPPLWLSAPAFYTDFLSLSFPVGGLCLALCAERAAKRGCRAALYAAAGLCWGVGALVKITVLVAPIALGLWQILRGKWRCAAAVILAAGLAFGALSLALDRAVYPGQLDREKARETNTPLLHWVMMGLRGDGFYNGEDYEFTRSFADPAERSAAVRAETVRRIRELGPGGLARHMLRKAGYILSDGTLMLSDYYDDHPQAPEALRDLLLPGGERYALWKAVSSGAHLAMLLLAVLGAAREALRRSLRAGGCVFPAVFGLVLFLIFWETSRRYWINFLPLFALCAALGLAGGERGDASGAGARRVL